MNIRLARLFVKFNWIIVEWLLFDMLWREMQHFAFYLFLFEGFKWVMEKFQYDFSHLSRLDKRKFSFLEAFLRLIRWQHFYYRIFSSYIWQWVEEVQNMKVKSNSIKIKVVESTSKVNIAFWSNWTIRNVLRKNFWVFQKTLDDLIPIPGYIYRKFNVIFYENRIRSVNVKSRTSKNCSNINQSQSFF